MAEKQSMESVNPPVYRVSVEEPRKTSSTYQVSKKVVIGSAVAVTVILLAAIIVGVVYFYRSTDTLKDVAKMYHTIEKNGQTSSGQDIEIDTNKNIVVVHLTGDEIETGTFALLDYTKSLTGIYDAKERKCYLIGGIQQEFLDPQHFKESLEKNNTQSTVSGKTFRYKLAESYPVSDKSFLPSPLKKVCSIIPVNWLEPALETSGTGIQKRGWCFYVCVNIRGQRVCYQRCN